MAPKNNSDDLLAFDDLYSMHQMGSRSMDDSVAPNSFGQQNRNMTSCRYGEAKELQPQHMAQASTFSMDEFSFMETPVPSMVTRCAEQAPPSIEQCFSSPEFSAYDQQKQESPAPWDIQQCHTAPDLESENPFDVFDYAPAPAPIPSTVSHGHELVQSPTQESYYSDYGFEAMMSPTSTAVSMFDQEARRPSCAAPAPPAEQHESALISVNKVPVKSPSEQLRQTSVATEVLHPWSEKSKPSAARQQHSFEEEEGAAMDTYRQGMKGDHGQKQKAGISLAGGMTNASAARDNIPTTMPLCWHKELDKVKQQAKIERARAKIVEKKARKTRPEQKCKGLRAVFGSPKEMNKRPKADPTAPKVVMNPNVTKSLAKGSLVKLVGSPKPLQKRPNEAAKNMFV